MTNKRIFTGTLTILGALALTYFLARIWEILLVLFLAIVFASTIRPAVEMLERRGLTRALSIIVLYLVILVGVAGLLILVIPSLIDMGIALFVNGTLMDNLRQFASQLSLFGWRHFGVLIPVFTLPDRLLQFLKSVGDSAGQQALPIAEGTILTLGQIVLVFVMAFYWLTARSRILDLLLRLSSLRNRETVQSIWTDVENTLGAGARGHPGRPRWPHRLWAYRPSRRRLVRAGTRAGSPYPRPPGHAPSRGAQPAAGDRGLAGRGHSRRHRRRAGGHSGGRRPADHL